MRVKDLMYRGWRRAHGIRTLDIFQSIISSTSFNWSSNPTTNRYQTLMVGRESTLKCLWLVPIIGGFLMDLISSTIVLIFQVCPRKHISDVRRKRDDKNKEVSDMEPTVDLGWLVVITMDSRVSKLRLSAAMDMSSFVAFESAEDEPVPA
jgi:hypothetical protein